VLPLRRLPTQCCEVAARVARAKRAGISPFCSRKPVPVRACSLRCICCAGMAGFVHDARMRWCLYACAPAWPVTGPFRFASPLARACRYIVVGARVLCLPADPLRLLLLLAVAQSLSKVHVCGVPFCVAPTSSKYNA
jgi:hypothetical protein